EHLHYNYKTAEMDGSRFRTGKTPVFAAGESFHGERAKDSTNSVYTATNAFITSDDYQQPLQKLHAKQIKIVPGKYFEARNATVYVGNVPVFYFPYYRRSLEKSDSTFDFIPGYRGVFGPYLLSSYRWVLNDELNGVMHADWREKRGFGVGPDFNYNLGQFGVGTIRYYYAHDLQPGLDPFTGLPLPENRQRFYLSYDATLQTNLTVKSQVAHLSDPYVVRDFFESQYKRDIQPNTFVDADKVWPNWSLDTLVQPRVNAFYETVERLPEVRLSGFRQQIFNTPLYYESESSIGYFSHLFSNTNSPPIPDFSAMRADTFHQITLPETFFDWLNVVPRVGGRFTHYSSASGPGATTSTENREVFNTGAEISFKASRVWQGAQSQFWDIEGLRHIIEPSMNYVFIPRPNVLPSQVPQFDYELTNSLQLLPIDFPDFNAIDSINAQNTIRFGLNNRLQTKRNAEIGEFADWAVFMDWNLRPNSTQTTFSDIYSSFVLRPRTWLIFNSDLRYSIKQGNFNLAQNRLTFQPNSTWSWSVGNFFLRSNTNFGVGNDLFTSLFFYRFNENWGTRIMHYFDAKTGTLQEQDYSIYRDLRSWTAAVTFRVLNSQANGVDYGVAATFSLKAFPKFGLGQDTVNSAPLLGY
ncbi:MAG TPA: LPS assembly protein LptD, partial [Verrucomicrobiae bacterium]|nr:LPS assembly protein LptD [Verrucomicrobiae bacterium]